MGTPQQSPVARLGITREYLREKLTASIGVSDRLHFCRRLFVGVASNINATTAPVRSDIAYSDRDDVHMLNASHVPLTAIPRSVRYLPTQLSFA